MNIVIVGGGKVGYYLVKTLSESGNHSITLLEKDPERCMDIAEELDCLVIRADGTDIDALAQARASDADVLVAVSGQDQDNLVSCQIAKTKYGIGKTIARVNNPKNHDVFKLLGVDTTVSSTGIIAELIEGELSAGATQTLLMFEGGELELMEAEVKEKSRLAGNAISRLGIPADCIVIAIYRAGHFLIPTGSTELMPCDRVMALTLSRNRKSVASFFSK